MIAISNVIHIVCRQTRRKSQQIKQRGFFISFKTTSKIYDKGKQPLTSRQQQENSRIILSFAEMIVKS